MDTKQTETSTDLARNPELEATIAVGTPVASMAGVRRFSLDTLPGTTVETRGLLQSRLFVALGILSLGFTLFFVRGLFLEFRWPVQTTQVVLLLLLAGGMTALALRSWSVEALRRIEVAEFLAVLVCLVVTRISVVVRSARMEDSLYLVASAKATILYVLLLITIYCMFIPNRWQRAARMVAVYIFSPVIVMFTARFVAPDVGSLVLRVASVEQVTENLLVLLTGGVCVVYGTHVINRLRGEVREARQIGQYKLGTLIGSGGMGQVYRAEHAFLKRPCAVKLIAPDDAFDSMAITRFEREVQAAASLTHWNTIDIYDYGQTDEGLFFYVMELLDGLSLQQLVDVHGPLPPARLVFLLRQICDALSEAESAGLVHRDIKPSNIFVAAKGGKHDVAKLLDFGLVLTNASEANLRESSDWHMTGSPLYLSPEQATGQLADGRSDIYSLGAVMYFALTGRPPFNDNDAVRVILAHAENKPIPLRSIAPTVPENLAATIHRCLEKDRTRRYPTASELAIDLAACECSDQWSFAQASDWWQPVSRR